MTRSERRREQKKYEKDFAAFCKITKQYFPELIQWLQELKDPRKFWTYEIEVILMTVIMKNICNIHSMQKMTDEFLKEECVENLCRILNIETHEFLPHYVTINEFLSKMEVSELECLRKKIIRALLRRRKFENAKFLGKYWMVIFDATGLFHFSERHCPHCLKKVLNKGTKEEKEIYYHHVLEAKLVLGDGLVISIGTEFIENEDENVSKNDCETKAFKRLSERLKKEYPRKGKVKETHHMEWVPEIDYRGYKLTLLALEIEVYSEKTGRTETKMFQWLTDLRVTGKNAGEFARVGRGRWQIENEGFNIQKNIRYDIQHVNSENYNAMKCHYLLTQIADILLQLYEKGSPGLREAKRTIKNISSDLLKSFGKKLSSEDILFIETHGYVKAVV